MAVFVRAGFSVAPDQRQQFELVAAELRSVAHTERGVIGYEWHAGDEPNGYLVIEHFADSSAMITHAEIAAGLLEQLAAVSRMTFMELYGEVSSELRAKVASMPQSLRIYAPAAQG
ncbi:antibiotic biosynthesis monooxygenase family protein [Streptomyces sp. enrichment culture]|uniref:antibiotic biosynthesis monooxygenase family protein n=1 Tax=Streptomyces sp. enrichment culture TaxID=1795815 RepID=UPI003F548438